MPIFFRWIFHSCLGRVLATMLALLSIYFVIEVFDKARYLGNGLTTPLLIEYLLLRVPYMLAEFMPVILLIAVSVFITEISRSHELAAMRSLSLGLNKLLLPISCVALLAAATSFAIGEWVTPITNKRLDYIEKTAIHKQPVATSRDTQWFKDGNRFYRLTPLNKNFFSLTMLEIDEHGKWRKRIDAPKAFFQNGRWTLTDLYVSQPDEETGIQIKHQDEATLLSDTGPKTASPPLPRHMQFSDLRSYTTELKKAGLAYDSFEFELHHKLTAPLACLVMAVLALALCMNLGSRFSTSSWGLLGAISMGLGFYVIGNASSMLGQSMLPAAFAAWLPTFAFGGFAGFMLLHREGY